MNQHEEITSIVDDILAVVYTHDLDAARTILSTMLLEIMYGEQATHEAPFCLQ